MSKNEFNMTSSRKEILDQLYDLTSFQTTGALIIGEPRAGKTTIINAFQALLGKRYLHLLLDLLCTLRE